jgi:hypothetical protein
VRRDAASILVILLSGAVSVGALTRRDRDTIDWQQAADAVSSQLQPGDCLVISPSWSRNRLEAFEESGIPVITAADGESALAAGFRRAWVMHDPQQQSVIGGRAEAVRGNSSFQIQRQELFGVTVDLLDRTAETRSASSRAVDLFREATVQVLAADGRRRACSPSAGDFSCGPDPWERVALTSEAAAALPFCILASPSQDATYELQFPEVTLTRGLTLRSARRPAQSSSDSAAPVIVSIWADDTLLARLVHPVGATYWQQTWDGPKGVVHPRLELSTTDRSPQRLCFDFSL